jgi:hypothetical protein
MTKAPKRPQTGMRENPVSKRWAIYLIRKRGELLGSVDAPDEKAAIAAAIEKYGISDPERQKRLIAKRSG